MPPALSQDNRIAKLHSPYPKDDLLLVRFDGDEGVNQISEYRIDVTAKSATVDLETGIGKPACIEMETESGSPRFFSGILVEAEWLREHHYRLVVRSSLWLLSLRRNMHIFRDQSPEEIINQILTKHGIASEILLSPMPPTMEYTVQFGETDLEFLTRLMSRFGMSYCFRSTMNADEMVITNHMDGFPKIPGDSRKVVDVEAGYEAEKGEYLSSFRAKRKLTTGKVTLTDYNMIGPSANMEKEATVAGGGANRSIEAYDSPAPFVYLRDSAAIDDTIKPEKVRLDQYRSEDHRYVGRGDLVELQAGERVKIEDISDPGLDKKTFLAVRHSFSCGVGNYISSAGGAWEGGEPFVGVCEFVNCDYPFAPPLVRPNRMMDGIQTAKVVGSGDIDVDKWGRILVSFPWDREQKQSIRVRVAQLWAGANWGGIHIPRVGMEVVVQFVDGDVDKPMVTGCVYNADNMPPYELPGEKNISGIKSNSVEGSGGYNEYVFDDTSGAELIRQHAQFNMDTVVENNETREIMKDRTTKVLQNDTIEVTMDEKHTVGQNFTVTADVSIKLKCGSSEIEMTPTGITIKALSIDVKATAALTTSGLTAEHKATSMMTIKGAMVMIN